MALNPIDIQLIHDRLAQSGASLGEFDAFKALRETHANLFVALDNLLTAIDGTHDDRWIDRCKLAALTALSKSKIER